MGRSPLEIPELVAGALFAPFRADLRRSVRHALGVPSEPPPGTSDPAHPFLAPDGVARQVHADLPSMVVGGMAALMLQTLHPLAMAGVADHSNYKEHAIGRLRRTAAFVGATTFGSVDEANVAIEHVREVHRAIRGTAPDGRPYAADDPDLLTWVHVAEMWCFLQACQRYGPRRLSPEEADRYLAETSVVARALGAEWVPETVDEVAAYFRRVRPELYAGPQAMGARDFLLRGVSNRPGDRAVHALIVAAAITLLPGWARRELRLAVPPLVAPVVERLVVAPTARAMCSAVRWTAGPPTPAAT
ncbi:MAG: oxygenase MpaB family protein [Acidimicrobiales bacterium]